MTLQIHIQHEKSLNIKLIQKKKKRMQVILSYKLLHSYKFNVLLSLIYIPTNKKKTLKTIYDCGAVSLLLHTGSI